MNNSRWVALANLVVSGFFTATILAGCGSGTSTPPPVISVGFSPSATQTVAQGQSVIITAIVSNDPSGKGVTWKLSGPGALAKQTNISVEYDAPASVASTATATIVATAIADASKSASDTVTITPPQPVAITVSPDSVGVVAGNTQSFTATISNDPSNKGVTWSISPASGAGTLSNSTSTSVTFNAPASPPVSDLTATITATSVADTSQSGSATAIVLSIGISVLPASVTVAVNASQDFTAMVVGDPSNKGVTWSLLQNGAACMPGCGTLSNQTATSVTYNAPGTVPSNAALSLTATSITDTAKSATADIGLTNPNAALNGHYAFLFNGFDDVTGKQIAAAGSFMADGQGKITGGVEDINEPSELHSGVTFTGTYVIGLDNRGTATLTNALGGKITYALAAGSWNANGVATKGRLIEFDDTTGTNGKRGSGFVRLQDTSAFSQSSITGPYAFGLVGQDASGHRRAVAGVFNADGAGKITGGTEDVNNAGTVSNGVNFTGTYTTPSSTNGRASVTLDSSGSSSHQSVYVVSTNELVVISTDAYSSAGLISGTEISQTSITFSNGWLTGNSVFYQVGVNSSSPTTLSDVEIGQFSSDGVGGLSLTYDRNDGGLITANATISGLTYAAGSNGRVTISGGTVSQPILYLVDTNRAFVLGTNGSVALGFLEPQSGGSISGNYFFGVALTAVTASTVSSGVAKGFKRITSNVVANGVIPSASSRSTFRADVVTALSAVAWWLPLALFIALYTLVRRSRRKGFRSAAVLASVSLLAVLGLAGCVTRYYLARTEDSSSSDGTLASGVPVSSQFDPPSNGRITISGGVIYVVSPQEFVLIDASGTSPTVRIYEQ